MKTLRTSKRVIFTFNLNWSKSTKQILINPNDNNLIRSRPGWGAEFSDASGDVVADEAAAAEEPAE